MNLPKVKVIDTEAKNRITIALHDIGALQVIERDPGSERAKATQELQKKYMGQGVVVEFVITPLGERILLSQLVRRMKEEHGPEVAKLPADQRSELFKKTIELVKAEYSDPSLIEMLINLTVESCEIAGLIKPEPEEGKGHA